MKAATKLFTQTREKCLVLRPTKSSFQNFKYTISSNLFFDRTWAQNTTACCWYAISEALIRISIETTLTYVLHSSIFYADGMIQWDDYIFTYRCWIQIQQFYTVYWKAEGDGWLLLQNGIAWALASAS